MTLADVLSESPLPEPPARYRKHAEFDETGGTASTGPVRQMVTDYRELLTLAGLDPDAFRIVGKVSQWTKTHHDKEDTYSFLFTFEPIPAEGEESDIARELASMIKPVRPLKAPHAQGLPMVVCLADGQMGKDGPDADTIDEMNALFESALAQVAAMVKVRRPSELIIADNGDPVEGITSSAPNQIATNLLDFPEQIRQWQRRLTQTILTLAPLAGRTHIVAVPSNHGEVRNSAGKVGYGDHGLGVARTVMDAFELLGTKLDLTFHFPASQHDVITYVDVADTRLAFTHGHHAKQIERMPQWIANQAASLRSPMRDATIVVHGHFHQPGYRESRGRCIVSCSMFDPGSSWFENLTGEWSRPSITTFSVRDKRVFDIRFVEPQAA
ncbi:hypothetical protein [Microbacterium sp. MMO-10]|uniref:hypothetical protein n=1 Tax=Microbacterium sp. MMO-10 TaxID=3081272 RepID=UPI003019252C